MKNPYRQILRRHFPEPVLALLIFLMGVWLWDNHLGPTAGYERDTCRMALLKLDRDLRLAESSQHLPPLVRKLLAIGEIPEIVNDGVAGLSLLAREHALDEDGAYALVILHSVAHGKNPVEGPFSSLGLPGPPDPRGVMRRFIEGEDRWWDREYLRGVGESGSLEHSARLLAGMDDARNFDLLKRTALARGAVLAIAALGLAFIPATLRAWRRALKSEPRGYTGSWNLGTGLGIFLLAYLSAIGFGMLIDTLLSGRPDAPDSIVLPPPVLALLYGATQFLPALIALAFLFRKARHAVSRLGLGAPPEIGLILGSFALLTAADFILRRTLGEAMPPDPAGGLSSSEAGFWGLALALSSVCLAAPIAEEILYRGILFRSLANRLRVPAATILSAAVFALAHFYNLYGLASVAITGIACALCFAASGRLSTAIALHALYNAAIKLPEWIFYHASL